MPQSFRRSLRLGVLIAALAMVACAIALSAAEATSAQEKEWTPIGNHVSLRTIVTLRGFCTVARDNQLGGVSVACK